jgi:hypothetical protein
MLETITPKWEVETEVHGQKEARKEVKFLGTIRPHKGQSMWQLNLSSGEVSLAVYKEVSVDTKGNVRKKLITEKGFMYCTALNKRNAYKKFGKMLGNG